MVETMTVKTMFVKAFFVTAEFTVGVMCLISAYALYDYFKYENKKLAKFFAIGFGISSVLAFLCSVYIGAF
jgi:hypothetical protein